MKASYRKKILFIYSLFVVIISVLPISELKELENIPTDKAVHFLIYAVFILLYTFAFPRDSRLYVKSFMYAFSLGLFVEASQYLIPYRSFDAGDIITNGLGAAAGLLFISLRRQRDQ